MMSEASQTISGFKFKQQEMITDSVHKDHFVPIEYVEIVLC
jgi:hypothetical protein